VVSHDAVIDDYCYLTPGVVLAGYVHLEEGVYIGAGAVVKHRVTIGAGAVVGMGSVVLYDVGPGATVKGNPAR
jgi:acetyltransferase-like isoleucine patch superfamily enzyme